MAKIDWLSKGDKNSRFFHKVVKGKIHMNRVLSTCDEQGNRVEGDNVAMKFVEHFQCFMGKKDIVKELDYFEELFSAKLTESEALEMIKDVTNKEIKEAVFVICGNLRGGWIRFPF